jgi:hypothetical protein
MTMVIGFEKVTRRNRRILSVAAACALLSVAFSSSSAHAAEDPFRIQNYETKDCAAASFDTLPCGPDIMQMWIHGSGNSIRNWGQEQTFSGDTHYCLDADEHGAVTTNPCNGGNFQKWTHYSEGYLKNWATKQCLDMEDYNWHGLLMTKACDHSQKQKWAFKD